MHASSTCLRIPLAGQKYASVAAKRSPLSVPRSASPVVTHRAITSLSLRTAGSHRSSRFPTDQFRTYKPMFVYLFQSTPAFSGARQVLSRGLISRRQGIPLRSAPTHAIQALCSRFQMRETHLIMMNPLTFVPGEESLAATFLMGLLYHNFQSQSNPWKNTPIPHLTCLEAASHPRFSHKKFQKKCIHRDYKPIARLRGPISLSISRETIGRMAGTMIY